MVMTRPSSLARACLLIQPLYQQSAKSRGASRIFAIDINEDKFELAKQLGATDCLNPTKFEQPIQQVGQFASCSHE